MKNLILQAIAGVFGVLFGGVILGHLLDTFFSGKVGDESIASWLDILLTSISTAATFFAACIAIKAMREWQHQKNFENQEALIENTYALYLLGMESYNFCLCAISLTQTGICEPVKIDKLTKKSKSNYNKMKELYDRLRRDCILNDARNLDTGKHFSKRVLAIQNHIIQINLSRNDLLKSEQWAFNTYHEQMEMFKDEMVSLITNMVKAHSPKSSREVSDLIRVSYCETISQDIDDFIDNWED